MGIVGRYFNGIKERMAINSFAIKTKSLNPLFKKVDINGAVINFLHAGHLGDIIYALPTVFSLSKYSKINFYINTNQKSSYYKAKGNHVNNGFFMTKKSIEFLAPLLLAQPQINLCYEHQKEHIDYDLNDFRKFPFNYKYGSIVRWYFHVFGVSYNTTLPWLAVEPNLKYKNTIVVARSFRYRSPEINYDFLQKYNNIAFVGLQDEYNDMHLQIPSLKYLSTTNALELAQIIAGCKIFIGNQSFPFAIAEGLKVKRVLEVNFLCPNVIVDGDNGYDFCYQPQFEKIINQLMN